MERMLFLRLAAVAVIACACGSVKEVAGDGAAAGDAPPAADAPPPDAALPRRLADSVIFLSSLGANIRFSADTEGPGSCLSEYVEGCEIQTCLDGGGSLPLPHAGLITTTSAAGVIMFEPDEDGLYSSESVLWSDGEEVTITAAGDQVPAFEEVLVGPGNIATVVAPPFGGGLVISRAEPLEVEWTGAEEFGGIAIRCDQAGSIQVRCPFDSGTSGVVPVAALERLPACVSANVTVFTENRRLVEPAPEWLIRVALRGGLHPTTATIE
jgi:hypothetical protein